jgi:transposase InsO family protein
MVVGWQLASHMRTALIVDALAMAVDGRHVQRGAIFHSDYAGPCVMPRIGGIACAGWVA